jgi:hypothetical protein
LVDDKIKFDTASGHHFIVPTVGMAVFVKKENGRSRNELRRPLSEGPEENHEALYLG